MSEPKKPSSTPSPEGDETGSTKFGDRVNYPLRLPSNLHEDVMKKAKRNGMTLNSYLIELIRKDLEKS